MIAGIVALSITSVVTKMCKKTWYFIKACLHHQTGSVVKNMLLKGFGMSPWLVLVSPCFRENVVATCKIGSFLCSLDNLLQKNVIVLFFGNQISKWCSFEKKGYFDLFFTFSSHQGKLQKFLHHISQTHTYTYFAQPIDFFCLTRFLFGMSPGVDSNSCHFGTINK